MVNIANIRRKVSFQAVFRDGRKLEITLQETKSDKNIFEFEGQRDVKVSIYDLFCIVTQCFRNFPEIKAIDFGYQIYRHAGWTLDEYIKDFIEHCTVNLGYSKL